MLDVRVSEGTDTEALVAFVERLAGSGRGGPAVRAATARIVGDVRAERVPAGLRILSGSLNSPVPPRPADDTAETLAGVLAEEALVVLSDTGTDELARALAALTGEGMRILLTGGDAERLAALRAALAGSVADRIVDRLPGLSSVDLRRLRRLLATVGRDRTARTDQELPPEDVLPAYTEVFACCRRADRIVDGTAGVDGGEAQVIPGLLRDLDAERRAAVTQVARCVVGSLGSLAGEPDAERLRDVVGRLVHGGLRTEFESLQGLAARQRDDRVRFAAGPPVQVQSPLPAGGDDVIRQYLDFLDGGGRSRSYFRAQPQRDAVPMLDRFRVAGEEPSTHDHVAAIVNHLDLARRDDEIARLCSMLGLSIPRSADELPQLTDTLDRIAATARSVGALRHDVLFLQQNSPVSVPDLQTAERVGRAIVDYDDHGDPAEASDELERFAQTCEESVPLGAMAPEHTAAVAAVRAHDPDAYAEALDELGRARREVADRQELERLLGELAGTHRDLARAWAADATRGARGFGLVAMTATDDLLAALPPADATDLVVVLGTGSMQADGLLLTAAAPRMLAVVGDEPRAESSGTTLLEVLNQASARFLRGTGMEPADQEPAEATAVPAVPPASSVPEQPGPVDERTGPEVPAPRSASAPGGHDQRPSAPSAMAPAARPAGPGGGER
ncbi:hypothetical protein C8E95_3899 [Pseudonocardia autotrophica]|uniref:Uncharacterized protein n=3 Tax=Pseudonocardiaceae TaxID=2070 RepID=A0A1Y2MP63_PSEAH|nr:hypothetical protein BG845_05399 [Pseudonocardia autotrophica]TDN74769.1 hypothetical protein C8E95_3899 [Pseudonocardia autotrophica]BBG05544.1 hypothetical protein Pdca_67530 [Pseudonocardia autotrophica]GEC29039.1 hypothetical protein PSA01_60680 [Pseudonocardia saturnea]